ncbi:MAG: YdcF family protein [Desertifilum sp. SIO1I2]|nr:YdcF family protein [Desertifilum sp. SIO1I2]
MFLFLSKLLPIFVYPLGLACVLIAVSGFLVWKRPRWAVILLGIAFAVLVLGGNGWVSTQLVRSLEWQNIPSGELDSAGAIVVLGGGIKPRVPPRPWVDFAEAGDRIIHGAQLYRQGKAPLLVLSGGRIDWKEGGAPESTDMAEIAELIGVPGSAILQDPTSLNTYQNAVNVRNLLEPLGVRRILLVTSALHMPRSRLIFQKQGFDAIPAPTDFLSTQGDDIESATLEGLILKLVPDVSNLQQTTNTLKEYIGMLIYRLRGWL